MSLYWKFADELANGYKGHDDDCECIRCTGCDIYLKKNIFIASNIEKKLLFLKRANKNKYFCMDSTDFYPNRNFRLDQQTELSEYYSLVCKEHCFLIHTHMIELLSKITCEDVAKLILSFFHFRCSLM